MNKSVAVAILVGGFLGWAFYVYQEHSESHQQSVAQIRRPTATAPAKILPPVNALPTLSLALGPGVQYYCLENYELASCMGYVNECGLECKNLLPPTVLKRMLRDYNAYRGQHGLAAIPEPAPSRAH